jgi:hypothetical protein
MSVIEMQCIFEYWNSNSFTVKLFEYLTIRISVFDARISIIIKRFVLRENLNE